MCGIVGVFHRATSAPVDREIIQRMREAIAYRGPDAASEYIDARVGLGIRRLAIIDLVGGAQPISSPDGRYTIIFNGEIYNYRELRRNLEHVYPFRTQSDTEVLLAHLIKRGPDGLAELNGMFAFALWDRKKEELLLARDRFGKKPLYLADLDGMFLFGSEPKSLLAHPDFPRGLDRRAIAEYFLYEYIHPPRTPFAAMAKLPPGWYARVGRQGITQAPWWRPEDLPTASLSRQENPLSAFDAVLQGAVTARMVADVPVGVLLSGGIDSTTIAWYMRQQTNDLHSFSVSFREKTFDESSYAQLAARSLQTRHHDVPFTLERFHEMLPLARERLDEPLGDASLLPTLAVSQEARRFVTVVLDGDGADELLLGYNTFQAYDLAQRLDWLPAIIRQALARTAGVLPTRYTDFSLDFKLKSFLRGLPFRGALRNQVWLGSFHDRELRDLLAPAWQISAEELYEPVTTLAERLRALPPLEQLSRTYLLHYLSGDILMKIDRATMYWSLEARTPYLDPRVVAFVLSLPLGHRYRAFRGKRLLADVMRGRIPEAIRRRPKKGFGMPLGAWLHGPLRSLLTETLAPERVAATGILRPEPVQQLVAEHLEGRADHRKKLWTLMVYLWWHEQWAK